jgi:hypothetical protein
VGVLLDQVDLPDRGLVRIAVAEGAVLRGEACAIVAVAENDGLTAAIYGVRTIAIVSGGTPGAVRARGACHARRTRRSDVTLAGEGEPREEEESEPTPGLVKPTTSRST